MEKQISLDYIFVDIIVTGYYTEAEECTQYGNDLAGYPGSPAEFEIQKITVKDSDVNIYDLISESNLKEINDLCLRFVCK